MSYKVHKTQAFVEIASQYDVLNDMMSFGLHRTWKRNLVKKTCQSFTGPVRVLDVASGTGDMAKYFLEGPLEIERMVGIDPSSHMLKVAKKKIPKAEFYISKAEKMNFDDEHFNILTCTFGPRNMDNLDEAIIEWKRLLAPGGVVGVLESHPIEKGLFNFIFEGYWKYIVPALGAITGKSNAYKYLSNSTADFLSVKELKEKFEKHGFETIQSKSLMPYGQIGLGLFRKPS